MLQRCHLNYWCHFNHLWAFSILFAIKTKLRNRLNVTPEIEGCPLQNRVELGRAGHIAVNKMTDGLPLWTKYFWYNFCCCHITRHQGFMKRGDKPSGEEEERMAFLLKLWTFVCTSDPIGRNVCTFWDAIKILLLNSAKLVEMHPLRNNQRMERCSIPYMVKGKVMSKAREPQLCTYI